MSSITACKVPNKSSETGIEELTVCTEWSDSKIRVFILKSDQTILTGEILLQDFSKYAKTFDKSLEIYLEETKNILSGKNDNIEFHLKEDKFFWKNQRWALGQVIVKSVSEIGGFSDVMLQLIDHYSNTKKTTSEFENLQNKYSKLCKSLDEMMASKLQMETDLYKKFILILNSKKAKIRELKSKLEMLEGHQNPIFDASTDESGNECDSMNSLTSYHNLKNKSPEKRILIEESDNCKPFKRKCIDKLEDEVKKVVENVQVDIPSISSTSENLNATNIGEDEETPDLLTDESECEFELKLEEEKVENDKLEDNAITEESEEMF